MSRQTIAETLKLDEIMNTPIDYLSTATDFANIELDSIDRKHDEVVDSLIMQKHFLKATILYQNDQHRERIEHANKAQAEMVKSYSHEIDELKKEVETWRDKAIKLQSKT